MSVVFKHELTPLEKYMVQGIKDCQTNNIKFTNTVFNCETIEDADGNIFRKECKRGKWIEEDDGWDGVYWRCSECDGAFCLVDGTPEENKYNFCPSCGADMRGEEHGE